MHCGTYAQTTGQKPKNYQMTLSWVFNPDFGRGRLPTMPMPMNGRL